MLLEWTEPALDDLAGIRDYIAKDSPANAQRFIERIFKAAEKLADFPKIGRPVPEAEEASGDIRKLIVGDYRIIYWVKPDVDRVQVLTVIHGARDLTAMAHKPWA